jgi:hypothetical protein
MWLVYVETLLDNCVVQRAFLGMLLVTHKTILASHLIPYLL